MTADEEKRIRGGRLYGTPAISICLIEIDALRQQLAALRKEYDEEVVSHDIEESGLKQQLAEAQELKHAIGEQLHEMTQRCNAERDTNSRLFTNQKRLESALQQYADPEKWSCLRCHTSGPEHARQHDQEIWNGAEDGPVIAQQALAGTEGEKAHDI